MYNIIGDIHSRDVWKKLVREDCVNVFVGDYFSPYEYHTFNEQEECFMDIVLYKMKHPETIMLIGNHDEDHWHIREMYSRFDMRHYEDISRLFEENKDYLQIAYSIENKILVTHAGVSVVWYEGYFNKNFYSYLDNCTGDDYDLATSPEEAYNILQEKLKDDTFNFYPQKPSILEWNNKFWRYNGQCFEEIKENPDHLAKFINDNWLSGKYNMFNFRDNSSREDYYGESYTHGPLWIRPSSLRFNDIFKYSEFKQVVGHTKVKKIICNNNIYFIDTLSEKNPESLLIDINKDGNIQFSINKI